SRTRVVSRSAARPRTTPSDGSRGVVSSLPTNTAPAFTSCSTKSVKVPPMSKPRRQEEVTSELDESETRGKIEAERSESPVHYSTVGRRPGPRASRLQWLPVMAIVLTGAPASGKSSVAERLASCLDRAAHIQGLLPEDGQGRLRVAASL